MTFTAAGQPYCAELPAAVLEIVAAEPSSPIGLSYQRYVRSTYLPAVRRIAAVLREHAAAIEWPSLAWLKEKFPGRISMDSSDIYAKAWLAYTRSWETLLAAWDEGGCAAGNDPLCRCLLSSVPDHRHPPSRRRGRHRRRLTVAPTARLLRRHAAWVAACLHGALHMHPVSLPPIPAAAALPTQ